jgi:uncharacterized protein (TIGR02001 family)
MSDWRYRGVSLSLGQPAASLSLSLDHPSGAYAAVSGVVASTPNEGLQVLGYQLYVGYAHRTAAGASLDFGFTHTRLDEFGWPKDRIDYSEVYAGVSWRDLAAHIYVSPDYLGDHVHTVYLDLDKTVRLDARWRLFGHVGVLAPVGGQGAEVRQAQYDLRAGAALDLRPFQFELAWSRFGPGGVYPPYAGQSRDAVVVSARFDF